MVIGLQDMKIEDPEIVDLVNQIEELERKLHAHSMHKVCNINSESALPLKFWKAAFENHLLV